MRYAPRRFSRHSIFFPMFSRQAIQEFLYLFLFLPGSLFSVLFILILTKPFYYKRNFHHNQFYNYCILIPGMVKVFHLLRQNLLYLILSRTSQNLSFSDLLSLCWAGCPDRLFYTSGLIRLILVHSPFVQSTIYFLPLYRVYK